MAGDVQSFTHNGNVTVIAETDIAIRFECVLCNLDFNCLFALSENRPTRDLAVETKPYGS